MTNQSVYLAAAATFFLGVAFAEDHTQKALEHASEAASSTDSKSIGEHSAEALKHIEAAKAVSKGNPDAIKHLKASEAELKAAEQHSHWYNTDTASKSATEGKDHLEHATGK